MISLVVLLLITGRGLGDSVTNGTTLIQAFLIHRHGDRTPISSTIMISSDVESAMASSAPFGYGQLTDVGKRNAYRLGQFIRGRYSSLLSPTYNSSEIYIRSTDSTRTKMSVLTAMSAVYPAYPGSWSEDINWVPVPYTTVPAKYDFKLATLNCPKLMAAREKLMWTSNSRMDKYSDTITSLASISNSDIVNHPVAAAFQYHDVYVSLQSLGVPLGKEVDALLPQIKQAANEAMDIIYGDEATISLNAGVLLNEFFIHASSIIAGEDTPRVRVYSAHDINVFSVMAAAMVTPHQGVPQYASAFALELRKVEKTGQYVVLPVYHPAPGEDLVYLNVAGCDVLCDLEQFKTLVSKYLLDVDTWRKECGFTENIVVDDSAIN